MLLELLSETFPEGTNLPSCTYDAKKMLWDLCLGYEKIHACKFDCALFWKENEFLDKCHTLNPNPHNTFLASYVHDGRFIPS